MSAPAADPGEVDRLLRLIRQRYGERLTDAQLDGVRRALETLVEQVTALRRAPLTNADEPLTRFSPFRADE
jgi:hypothetical protein